MSAKHTPGPWRTIARATRESNFGGYKCRVTGPDVARVATVSGGNTDEASVAEANARLVAAAPELLDELEKLLRAYKPLCLSSITGLTTAQFAAMSEVASSARAAIAKAKGNDQ